MKLIITGSTGFAGTNLIDYLKDFDLQKMFLRFQPNQSINLGIADAMIHLSGKAHDLKKVSQPQDYYGANFELTKQLYDAFLKSDAKKFIFISSVKAAADSVDWILTEETTPNPQADFRYTDYLTQQVRLITRKGMSDA